MTNVPATIENTPAISKSGTVSLAGATFRVLAPVTRRVLAQRDGIPTYVMFEGPAITSTIQAAPAGRSATAKMAPARVAPVIDLETGEMMTLIMNRVLESELERYTGGEFVVDKESGDPDPAQLKAGYVGRSFAVASEAPGANPADKRYRTYRIVEIVVDTTGVHKAGDVIEGDKPAAIDRAKKKA